jgi:hypothetical protein
LGTPVIADEDGIDPLELMSDVASLNLERLVDLKAPVATPTSSSSARPQAEVMRTIQQILETATFMLE